MARADGAARACAALRARFRPAEAGEFTRRAFLNGKMDLAQAEAVMDVINAGAEQSLKAALAQLHGSVSREVGAVESLLLDALSGIDAAIDYPERRRRRPMPRCRSSWRRRRRALRR